MRNSLFSLICGICTICGSTVFAAHEYGKTVYYGDVTTGTWPTLNASSNAVYTAAGTYTNGLYTNYYRLSYTNLLGRGPLAPVTIAFTGNPSTIPGTNTVTFIYTNILGHGVWVPTVIGYTGDTNTIVGTNTVSLTWQIQGGATAYIIERSLDAGTSWTNWTSVGPTTTNFYDYGTNTWTFSTFTNLYSLIPPPSVVGGGGTGLTVEVDPVFANWIPDHTADLAKSTLQSLGTVTLGAVGGGTVGDFTPASNLRGAIKFVHGDQSNNITTTIYASSSTTGAHYYLPAALPATGQVLGQSLNDGAYDLEWVTVDVDANRSYWGRNEAGEITLKAATNRLSDVYWTTNSTGEVILQ